MSSLRLRALSGHASLFCFAAMLLTGAGFSQSTASETSSETPAPAPVLSAPQGHASSQAASYASRDWSSSLASSQLAEFRAPAISAALPSAPAPSSAAAGQGANGGGGVTSGLAFEGGFGFNAPESDSIGWGWNVLIGAGYHMTPNFTPMIEYQFVRTGLAPYLIDLAGSDGGNTHIWSFTVDPVYDIAPKASNDFYIKGGGGFYRKVTNFTDAQPQLYCDYFYGCGYITQNVVVGHFSSNQGGWNIGGGYYHRFGGIYGTGKMKFFAEARYTDVLTPAVTGTDTNGHPVTTVPADTKLIPVTFGFSW
ncbi:MAG TPA: hypothetical protein VF730_02260 [Terracidiphilus sp.]